jgi:hypothetical protein
VIQLSDTQIHFSQTKVHVTVVSFRVHNSGTRPHNLIIGSHTIKTLRPGQTYHFLLGFPEVGKYLYTCTVNCNPGMRGIFQRNFGGHNAE